jgi:hypothetical protein
VQAANLSPINITDDFIADLQRQPDDFCVPPSKSRRPWRSPVAAQQVRQQPQRRRAKRGSRRPPSNLLVRRQKPASRSPSSNLRLHERLASVSDTVTVPHETSLYFL